MRVRVYVTNPYPDCADCPEVSYSFLIPDEVFTTMTTMERNRHIEQCAIDALDSLVYQLVGPCGWEIEEEITNG